MSAGFGEPVGIFGLPTHRHGEQRAAVKRVIEGDDFGFVRAVAGDGVMTRQFERRLVGLCAGVGEEHPVGEGGVDQFARQTQRRFIGEDVAGMPQGFALAFERLDQRRVAVSQRRHRDAAGKIDVLFSLLIPDPAAFAAHRHKLGGCINRQDHLVKGAAAHCGFVSHFRLHPEGFSALSRCYSENIITKYA